MSNSDLRAIQRTTANELTSASASDIDAAIKQAEGHLANLRKARGLVAEREKLAADLARLDQHLAGVIAGRVHASPSPPPRPLPPPVPLPEPSVDTIPPPDVKARPGRKAITLTHGGRTLSIYEWAAETGIQVATLRYRISAGWRPEMVLKGASYARGKREAALPPGADRDGEPGEIDIDASAAGATSGPALQKQLDEMDGKPVVLPAGMAFSFDPKAPAASVPALKIETSRRQKGGKSREVEFVTTASRNHVHVAVVDHFGDGQTRPDSTGHVHRLARWQMIEAHRHEHGLALTPRRVG